MFNLIRLYLLIIKEISGIWAVFLVVYHWLQQHISKSPAIKHQQNNWPKHNPENELICQPENLFSFTNSNYTKVKYIRISLWYLSYVISYWNLWSI